MGESAIADRTRRDSLNLLFVISLITLHVVAILGLFISQQPEYAADGRPVIAFFTTLIVAACIDVAVAFRVMLQARNFTGRAISGSACAALALCAGYMSANQAEVLSDMLGTVSEPVVMTRAEAVASVTQCRVASLDIGDDRAEVRMNASYVDEKGRRHRATYNYLRHEDVDEVIRSSAEVRDRCPVTVNNERGPE